MNAVLAVTKDTLLPLDEGIPTGGLGARIVKAVHETEPLLCFSKKMLLIFKVKKFYTLPPNGHCSEN
jgi:hypothetical protein